MVFLNDYFLGHDNGTRAKKRNGPLLQRCLRTYLGQTYRVGAAYIQCFQHLRQNEVKPDEGHSLVPSAINLVLMRT